MRHCLVSIYIYLYLVNTIDLSGSNPLVLLKNKDTKKPWIFFINDNDTKKSWVFFIKINYTNKLSTLYKRILYILYSGYSL